MRDVLPCYVLSALLWIVVFALMSAGLIYIEFGKAYLFSSYGSVPALLLGAVLLAAVSLAREEEDRPAPVRLIAPVSGSVLALCAAVGYFYWTAHAISASVLANDSRERSALVSALEHGECSRAEEMLHARSKVLALSVEGLLLARDWREVYGAGCIKAEDLLDQLFAVRQRVAEVEPIARILGGHHGVQASLSMSEQELCYLDARQNVDAMVSCESMSATVMVARCPGPGRSGKGVCRLPG